VFRHRLCPLDDSYLTATRAIEHHMTTATGTTGAKLGPGRAFMQRGNKARWWASDSRDSVPMCGTGPNHQSPGNRPIHRPPTGPSGNPGTQPTPDERETSDPTRSTRPPIGSEMTRPEPRDSKSGGSCHSRISRADRCHSHTHMQHKLTSQPVDQGDANDRPTTNRALQSQTSAKLICRSTG